MVEGLSAGAMMDGAPHSAGPRPAVRPARCTGGGCGALSLPSTSLPGTARPAAVTRFPRVQRQTSAVSASRSRAASAPSYCCSPAAERPRGRGGGDVSMPGAFVSTRPTSSPRTVTDATVYGTRAGWRYQLATDYACGSATARPPCSAAAGQSRRPHSAPGRLRRGPVRSPTVFAEAPGFGKLQPLVSTDPRSGQGARGDHRRHRHRHPGPARPHRADRLHRRVPAPAPHHGAGPAVRCPSLRRPGGRRRRPAAPADRRRRAP